MKPIQKQIFGGKKPTKQTTKEQQTDQKEKKIPLLFPSIPRSVSIQSSIVAGQDVRYYPKVM